MKKNTYISIIVVAFIGAIVLSGFLIIKNNKNKGEDNIVPVEQPFTVDAISVKFNIIKEGNDLLLKTFYENNSNKKITNLTLQIRYNGSETLDNITIGGVVSSGEKSKEVFSKAPENSENEDIEILKYKVVVEDGVYMEYNAITNEYNWS